MFGKNHHMAIKASQIIEKSNNIQQIAHTNKKESIKAPHPVTLNSPCISNHRRIDCLLNRLFRRKSEKTSKLRVSGVCEGNSPVTGEFPAPGASNAENVSIWWRHHEVSLILCLTTMGMLV